MLQFLETMIAIVIGGIAMVARMTVTFVVSVVAVVGVKIVVIVALVAVAVVIIIAILSGCSSSDPGQTARTTDTPSPAVASGTPTTSPGTSTPKTSVPTATIAPRGKDVQQTPRAVAATATASPESESANPTADTSTPAAEPTAEPEYEIVTLLPPDAIPAISNPSFLSAEEAGDQYGPDELVLGVEIDGDARAYSVPLLSRHEIVNDVVGGKPIAVTW